MKITKQRLKEIIKEELEFVGAEIDDIPEPPEDDETRDRAFASPRERLFILMNARKALSKMTSDELAALSLSLDAPMLATLQHILGNPLYKESLEEGMEYSWLPRGIAQEYIKGITNLVDKYGEEKVVRAYKNAGGSARQVAPMQNIEAML